MLRGRAGAVVAASLALLSAACGSGASHEAALTHATTTSVETTTTAAPTTTKTSTTTTRAPTTTRPSVTTTTATVPPATAPTTTALHHYPDAGFGCATLNSNQLTPVHTVPWNLTATVNWSDGFVENMSDNTPYKPPFTVTMVGSRGTRVTVSIYWNPTKPSFSIPPGPAGAWTCRLVSVS